ncbi:hypothetical protein BDFB_013887, partial [Asbolus verrucosus]
MDCGMKSPNMAKYIKATIHEVQAIGLKVVATICDQFNKPAINLLIEESRSELARQGEQHHTYSSFINGEEVMPLYDPPHLLKGIRNNMLNGDVHFKWRSKTYEVAKWEHIIKLYELDGKLEHGIDPTDVNVSDYRMLNRLTDAHVYPNVIKKLKVRNSAQVFSHRVSAVMRRFARDGNNLPAEAEQTANFLLFVDRLFDSVNGSLITPAGDAQYSPTRHTAFWMEAIQVLKTIKYRKNGRGCVPPTITNWILTLDGLLNLWRKLRVVGFDPSSNCEDDDTEGALDCFKVFLLDNREHEMHGVFAHSEANVSE